MRSKVPLSQATRSKLRVLLEELEATAILGSVPELRGSNVQFESPDWNLTARYLMPEIILHLSVRVLSGVRRETPTWFTITQVPTWERVSVQAVEACLEDPPREIRDAMKVMRAHLSKLQGRERSEFQRHLDGMSKVVDR